MSNDLYERIDRVVEANDATSMRRHIAGQHQMFVSPDGIKGALESLSEPDLAEFMREFDPDSEHMVQLMCDGHHGVYVWQQLALHGDLRVWNVSQKDIDWLKETDPYEDEFYWDEISRIEQDAYMEGRSGTWHLMQDGDLWAVHPCFNTEFWV